MRPQTRSSIGNNAVKKPCCPTPKSFKSPIVPESINDTISNTNPMLSFNLPPIGISKSTVIPPIGTPKKNIQPESNNKPLLPPPIVTPKFSIKNLPPSTSRYKPHPSYFEKNNVPKAPLTCATPKIGIPKSEFTSNPWYVKPEYKPEIKITGITPIGTIAMVPTLNKRPAPTPRYLPITKSKPNEQEQEPMLNATIYLDLSKDNKPDISDKMRSLNENTLLFQRQFKNKLKPLPNLIGCVSSAKFEEALEIYENNQVYYQDRIDDHQMDINTIKRNLTELEYWFIKIIEPRPSDKNDIEEWKNREQTKLDTGRSSYCDPELYPYITPAPTHILNVVSSHQRRLF